MKKEFYRKSIIVGNSCIWFASLVVLCLSVASVAYDVDAWLPFSYQPVLETIKVATAALVISTVILHLASFGWIALGYSKEWMIKTYMFGNGISSLFQMAIGIGVLVVQKRAWPYFKLISLHLCFERFTHQRSRRVARSVSNDNITTTTTTTVTTLESWFPTGTPANETGQQKNGFFDSLQPLPTKPGPEVPSDCLPTDLLTAAGSLLIIAALISVYLAFCSYCLWCNQKEESVPPGRNTSSVSVPDNDESTQTIRQEIPPISDGHPEKPVRHAPKSQEMSDYPPVERGIRFEDL